MKVNDSIKNYMATKLITFTPEVNIWDAISVIVKNKISGAPVLNEEGNLIGMLSEIDCIRTVLEGPYNNQPGGQGTVADYMTKEVVTIDADSTVLDAAYAFTNSSFRRYPVVENGKLVGQISRSDILKAISNLHPKVTIVPDSWKKRTPILNFSKQGRHSGNV